jgi:hypothetical protein
MSYDVKYIGYLVLESNFSNCSLRCAGTNWIKT